MRIYYVLLKIILLVLSVCVEYFLKYNSYLKKKLIIFFSMCLM